MHKRSDGFREGSTLQYVMVNKLKYEMPQNYYTLKYAHPSCNEYVQPQMGMPNMTMYRDTMLTK